MTVKYESLKVNAPLTDSTRFHLPLAGEWAFEFDETGAGISEGWMKPDFALAHHLQVPGAIQAYPEAFAGKPKPGSILNVDQRGHGWYARKVMIPRAWASRHILLKFGGICPEAELYLNGVKFGTHDWPQVAFGFDITDLAPPGHEADLRVHILENDRKKLGGLNQQWSGLWRTVELETVGDVCFTRLFCLPEPSTRSVRVFSELSKPGPFDIEVEVEDARGQLVGRASGIHNAAGLSVPLAEWHPWRPEHPTLYTARARLKKGRTLLDGDTCRFGLKYFETRGNRILLGGEPVFFTGFCIEGNDWNTVSPNPDPGELRAALVEVKAKGFNHARFHTQFPADEFFDAADEVGIMISAEVPYVSNLRAIPDYDDAWNVWTRIIPQTRNHASMAVYSMGNEGCGLIRKSHLKFIDCGRAFVKQWAPNALCIKTTGNDASAPGASDFETPSIGRGITFVDAARGFSRANWDEVSGVLARFPTVFHEWAKISALARIQEKPRIVAGRKYPAPFMGIYPLAEHKQMLSELPKWATASEHVYWTCLKLSLELSRLKQYWGGWQIYHRHPSLHGLQNDAFIFPDTIRSVAPETLLTATGPVTLLQDRGYQRRTLRPGAQETIALYVSNTTPRPIEDATVCWTWETVNHKPFVTGEWKAPGIAASGRTLLGHVDWVVPDTPGAVAVRLTVELSVQGKCLATNHWNYWIFPETAIDTHGKHVACLGGSQAGVALMRLARGRHLTLDESPMDAMPDVLVTHGWDKRILDYMCSGGRVLLFGSMFHELRARDVKTFADRTSFYVPYRSGWDDGNTGSLIEPHPALGDFPHEGFGDLQCFELFDGAYPQELERWPVPLTPIIRALPPLVRPANRGYLFEFRCGKGMGIVSTMASEDTPASIYLLSRLTEYACSETFAPEAVVPESFLRSLVSPFGAGVENVTADIATLTDNDREDPDAVPLSLASVGNTDTAVSGIRPGSRTLSGVTFLIGDKSFSPRSLQDPCAPWSADIPVERKVKAIYLAWGLTGLPSRETFSDYGSVKVLFRSELAPTLPLHHSQKTGNRAFTQEELAGLDAVGRETALHVSVWNNPRPDDRVEWLRIATEGKQARLWLYAVSVTEISATP